MESRSTPYYTFAVSLFFLFYTILLIKQIFKKKILVPHFDVQMVFTFLIVFPFSIGLMLFPLLDDFFWYLFIAKLVPFIVLAITIIFQLPKGFYRDILIFRSNKKLIRLKHLKTIVILGDKKSSELQTILFQLLNQKHNVVNVLGEGTIHNISKTISKKTREQTEYLIVPISSQEKEEIAEIIHTLDPLLCIIHADSNLPFNQSERDYQEFVSIFTKKTKLLSVGYSQESDFLKNKKSANFLINTAIHTKVKNLYFAKSIVIHRSFASFVMNTPTQKSIRIKTSIISPSILSSVVTATAIACELKFSNTQITKSLNNILPIEGHLNFKKTQTGTVLVNASNDLLSEESLLLFQKVRGVIGRKIVVYSASEDFGRANKLRYQEIGKKLSRAADIFYLVSSDNSKYVANGVIYKAKKSRFMMGGKKEILEGLSRKLHKNDIVLFVGQGTEELYSTAGAETSTV